MLDFLLVGRGGGGWQGGRTIVAPRHGFKTGYHASGRAAAVRCNGTPGSLVLHAEHVSMDFVTLWLELALLSC